MYIFNRTLTNNNCNDSANQTLYILQIRNKMKYILCIISVLTTCLSCGQNYQNFDEMALDMAGKSVPYIKVKEINNDKELVFLDARELKEYEISHIENSIFVGYDKLKTDKIKSLDKSKTYIIYCSVGYRSGKVGEKMQKMGFKHVFNLYGGIFDWKNKGGKVVNSNGETIKVHPFNKSWGKWLEEEYNCTN